MRAPPTARAAERLPSVCPSQAKRLSQLRSTRKLASSAAVDPGGSWGRPDMSPLSPRRPAPSLWRRHRPQRSFGGNAFNFHEVRFPRFPGSRGSGERVRGFACPRAQSSVLPLEVAWFPLLHLGLRLRVRFRARPERDSLQSPSSVPAGVLGVGQGSGHLPAGHRRPRVSGRGRTRSPCHPAPVGPGTCRPWPWGP